MTEQRTRQDSTRDLLEEIEDGWAGAPPSNNGPAASAVPAEADSAPNVNELDEGWLDQLFPEDDDDEEEEESEPELPDERLDPVAFAAAKKARDEKRAATKERKKLKLEAKRARQRAKAVAMRQKQKGKSKRKPAPVPSERTDRKAEKKAAKAQRLAAEESEREASAIEANDAIADVSPKKKKSIAPPARAAAAKKPNTAQSIKLLAIVLGVMLALAAVVAIVTKSI